MNIRWIVTDMDGTLLDSRGEITERTRAALMACQEKGIRVILASGRSYAILLPFVRMLELEKYGGFLIEINGLAYNPLGAGERQVMAQLERADVELLFSVAGEFQTEFQAYRDEEIYYWIPLWQRTLKEKERDEKGLRADSPLLSGQYSWVRENTQSYPVMKEIVSATELPESLNKVNFADNPAHIQEIYEMLKARYAERFEIVRTCPRYIEIMPRGISKGRTLRRCMEAEGISPEEVLAFGDGENDIDVFQCVPHSVAMGNAPEYVKKYASDLTESNDRDGVAAALERYGLL